MRVRVKKSVLAAVVALCGLLLVVVVWKVRINDKEGFEGLFFLRGENGKLLEITDDLFPEEAHRLLWGGPLPWLRHVVTYGACTTADTACLNFEWNKSNGRGFVKTTYADGRKLLICLGRFNDSRGLPTKGVFIGGDLPPTDPDYQIFNKNESGMAYFDGKAYFHIWCNVNEAFYSLKQPATPIYPTDLEFLGSDVIENSKNGVTIQSRHRAMIDDQPVLITKMFFYHTGDTFFILVTNIVNAGKQPVTIFHLYGDEPWLGNFGSSAGNVGWVRDRLIRSEEFIDTQRYSLFGMYDYGNELSGEKPGQYTGKANFIEWDKKTAPDQAYFSNRSAAPAYSHDPLNSSMNRFIGMTWGPRTLAPGQNLINTMAIGMAEAGPKGIPVKPKTLLN